MADMQTLMLDDALLARIAPGSAGNTVRTGRRAIAEGKLAFEASSGSGRKAEVTVTGVRHARADGLSREEILANGSPDFGSFVSGMRRFYPDFGPESEVTVISWAA